MPTSWAFIEDSLAFIGGSHLPRVKEHFRVCTLRASLFDLCRERRAWWDRGGMLSEGKKAHLSSCGGRRRVFGSPCQLQNPSVLWLLGPVGHCSPRSSICKSGCNLRFAERGQFPLQGIRTSHSCSRGTARALHGTSVGQGNKCATRRAELIHSLVQGFLS